MLRSLALSSATLFVLVFGIRADDKKEVDVKELDLTALKREPPKGSVDKPTEITSEDQLKKAFPEEELQAKLKKEVDFSKQQLLFFAWSGSGQDSLTVDTKGSSGNVVFKFTAGRTRDLRGHFHAFVLPKDAKWSIGK